MKKILALALALLMCSAVLFGCGPAKAETDLEYITDKGTMKIGYTLYEPMNYKAEDGTLTGFDTEFAELVCEKLGVKPEFIEINWDTKIVELNSKNIDCIWNGFTVDAERREQVNFSLSYLTNKQIIVVKAENAEKYATTADMAGLKVTAEVKSAGEKAILADATLKDCTYIPADKQTDVLLEIKSGTSDIGVIDYVMAKTMLAEGTDYSELVMLTAIELMPEEYAIGFRKVDDSVVTKVNEAINALAAEGKLAELAAKYDLSEELSESLRG